MPQIKKKKEKEIPEISTSSLPDIIFMLLFFFMVVTVLRDTTVMVEQDLPYADQIEKLERKNLVMYIYAGQPSQRYWSVAGTEPRIQLNDKFAKVSDIKSFILQQKQNVRPELRNKMITALKVDNNTNMGLITDIKHQLRTIKAYRISYSTREGDATKNPSF